MDYAIIKLGNKQHRVRDGETLVVDRVATEEGKTFEPVVLLGDTKVTATVVAHERGPKIIVGKYKRRTGYKRHTGFRAATSRLEITLGAGTKRTAAKEKAKPVKAEKVDAVAEAPAAVEEAPVEAAEVSGVPSDYESMTVAKINAAAREWSHGELEAALAYENEHGQRKGAIHALEAALKKDDEEPGEEAEE
jgi:large subunit ribosomal protein L21